MRQIGLSLHQYHDQHRLLPPGFRSKDDPYPFLSWRARLLPFLQQDALWLQIRSDFAREPRFYWPPRHEAGSRPMPIFVCPADGRTEGEVKEGYTVAFSHYLGISGITRASYDGVLFRDSRVALSSVNDGTSNTLMIGERPHSPDNRWGWWYAGMGQEGDGAADLVLGVREVRTTFRTPTCETGPYHFANGDVDNICDIFHYWSQHLGGCQFVLCDGSVRFLRYDADAIMPALATRSGREPVTVPD
jgi:hypothetical protein